MAEYSTTAAPKLGAPPAGRKAQKSAAQSYRDRWGAMETAYTTWRPVHQDICDFEMPGRGRFQTTEANLGIRQDVRIVNDCAVNAGDKLASAMDTAITSPVREWCRMTRQLARGRADSQDEHAEFLHDVQDVFFAVLARSNFYPVNPNVYRDLVGPATSLLWIEEDDKDVVRFTHVPIGQYRLWIDARCRVAGVARLVTMTAGQMIEKFGYEACSQMVKDSWDNDRLLDAFSVLHFCERRTFREPGAIDKKNKPWASCWVEHAGGTSTASGGNWSEDRLLLESGYDEQPFIAPRWLVVGEDAYGKASPGWATLGDSKALQALEKGSAKALAKVIDPPMNAPEGLANASLVPGAVNYIKSGASSKFEPSVVTDTKAITVAEEKTRQHERRIERGHFADVLFIISQDDRATPATAEEVRAKKDERLLQLGGVFGRIADEHLKPLVNRVLAICQRAGLFPPPPEGLGPVDLEFQNILVAAQKTLGISAVDRLLALLNSLIAIGRPDAVQKLDVDATVERVADMLGVDPHLLLGDARVKELRAELRRQQQAKAQGQAMTQAAPAVKELSQTDPEVLRQLLQQFGPNATAQATA